MTYLKKVGFFFELPLDQQRNAIELAQRESAHRDEDLIIQYLLSGLAYAAAVCVEADPLSSTTELIGPPHIQTDGVWAWPQSLAYYVERYHVRLPEDFVLHMSRNGWLCTEDVDVRELVLEDEETVG